MERFADLMVKDVKTGECFRADHLLAGANIEYSNNFFYMICLAHLEKLLDDAKLDSKLKEEYTSIMSQV